MPVELHVHLDGAIPPSTLLRVSRRRGLALPGINRVPETIEDVWTSLQSMQPVWHRFDLVNEIIGGSEDTLAEISQEFVDRQAAQNVTYTEVRWDPIRPAVSTLANVSISAEAAIGAVQRGLRAGCERHGIEVYQLLCAMRGKPGAACFDLARLASRTRSGELGGVVGMDIAGDEAHFNNTVNDYEACLRYAKVELLLNTTVHAGESYTDIHRSYADVVSAIEVMRCDRIGHGYASTHDEDTLELVRRRGVHLEACPAGGHGNGVNLAATGVYRARGLSFGLNTDDPTPYFANTTLEHVEDLVRSRLNFSSADIDKAYSDAYAASFARDARRIVAMQRAAAQPGPTPLPPIADVGGGRPTGFIVVCVLIGLSSLAFLAWAALGRRRSPQPPKEVSLTATTI